MKRSFYEDTWRKEPTFRALCAVLASCRDRSAMAELLRDLLTLSEMQAIADRLEVARMLAENIPYRVISRQTGSSTATITRVARFLENGQGYKSVFDVPRHHHTARSPSSVAHGAMEDKRGERVMRFDKLTVNR